MSLKRIQKGSDLVRVNFWMERSTYERLLKLKIAEGDGSSFTKWLNKVLAKVVNDNEVLIRGYKVDDKESDF